MRKEKKGCYQRRILESTVQDREKVKTKSKILLVGILGFFIGLPPLFRSTFSFAVIDRYSFDFQDTIEFKESEGSILKDIYPYKPLYWRIENTFGSLFISSSIF